MYGITEALGDDRRTGEICTARGSLRTYVSENSNFQSCKDARNIDYMNFSTRVGVSDDVTDVTKHD